MARPCIKRKSKSERLKTILWFCAFIFTLLAFSACHRGEEDPTRVSSKPLTLKEIQKEMLASPASPPVKVINIGPSKESAAPSPQAPSENLPPQAVVDTRLTSRLKEKMDEAFKNRGTTPPDVQIATSDMNLDSFAKYYEDKGFKVQRNSIQASQVISPLLAERPELANKISLNNYQGVTINQVIVEGANISAADKYIDPESYEIVNRTFITVTKMK